jgi:hypothetical protein
MATKSEKIYKREKNADSDDLTIYHGRKNLQSKKIISNNNPQSDSSPLVQHSQKKQEIGPKYTFSTEIPENYDENYICTIPRNPECLFVYWELSDSSLSNLKSKLGNDNGQSFLKIEEWNKTASAQKINSETQPKNVSQIHKPLSPPIYYVFPSDLNKQSTPEHKSISHVQNSSYIRVPVPGKEYRVEYGYVTDENVFISMSIPDQNRLNESESEKEQRGERSISGDDTDRISTSGIVQAIESVTPSTTKKLQFKTRYFGSASLD